MSPRIVPINYEGQSVTFNAEGWINATEAASRFGKLPHEWLRLPETAAYLEALAKCGKIPQLVRTQRGRNGGTWIHHKMAVPFARWLSVDFAVWCDEQIEALIRGDASAWPQARHQSSALYRGVCDAVATTLEASGKQPKPHHFMNEARLINQVVTGRFAGRDRNQLSKTELDLLSLLEVRDVMLLGQGKTFEQRKELLARYAEELEARQRRRLTA